MKSKWTKKTLSLHPPVAAQIHRSELAQNFHHDPFVNRSSHRTLICGAIFFNPYWFQDLTIDDGHKAQSFLCCLIFYAFDNAWIFFGPSTRVFAIVGLSDKKIFLVGPEHFLGELISIRMSIKPFTKFESLSTMVLLKFLSNRMLK